MVQRRKKDKQNVPAHIKNKLTLFPVTGPLVGSKHLKQTNKHNHAQERTTCIDSPSRQLDVFQRAYMYKKRGNATLANAVFQQLGIDSRCYHLKLFKHEGKQQRKITYVQDQEPPLFKPSSIIFIFFKFYLLLFNLSNTGHFFFFLTFPSKLLQEDSKRFSGVKRYFCTVL